MSVSKRPTLSEGVLPTQLFVQLYGCNYLKKSNPILVAAFLARSRSKKFSSYQTAHRGYVYLFIQWCGGSFIIAIYTEVGSLCVARSGLCLWQAVRSIRLSNSRRRNHQPPLP